MKQAWESKKAAIVLSYIGVFLQTLSTIVLTNLYLKKLGADTYGLYQMVYAVAQYILILDLGISTTMIRYIAEFDAKGETEKKENFAFHFLIIVGVLILMIVNAGIVVNFNLGNIYKKLTAEELALAHRMFLVMILQIALTVFIHYLKGLALANEKYAFVRLFEIIDIFIHVALVILFLYSGTGVIGIVYAKTAVILFQLVVFAVFDIVFLKFRIRFHYWDFRMLKPAFILMLAMLLQSVVGHVNNSVDKTILGIMAEKVDVTVYSIAATFVTMFNTLPTSISSVFQTKATKIVVAGASKEELTDFVVRPGRFQFMITGGFIAGFFLFGKDFIICWTNKDMSAAWLYTLIILVPNMIPLVQNTCLSILNAMDKRLFRSIILVAITVLNIGMTVLLIKLIGPVGAPLATGISYIIGHVVLMNIYYRKRIGLDVFGMFGKIFSKIWLCVLLSLLLNLPLMFWRIEGNWGVFIVKAAAFMAVYAASLWLYGLNISEKKMISAVLAKFRIRVRVKE